MKLERILLFTALVSVFAVAASGQRAEVTVSLNEQFFDSLLTAAFQNAAPPEFSIAAVGTGTNTNVRNNFAPAAGGGDRADLCPQTVTLLREGRGVRTGVRFRDGQIFAPIAFTGSYSPPLIGCVEFSGWAEAIVTIDFDKDRRTVRGHARILNVSLDGTGGIGGGLLARVVQSAIDKRINPIPLIELDKMSFLVPIQNSGRMMMKAVGLKTEVVGNVLNVRVEFEFHKA